MLSKREERELAIHLQGIEPVSLATIIWDSINCVGVDDEHAKFGIDFSGGKVSSDSPKVLFWDKGDATGMPRKVFLEILQMVSEKIIEDYENNYDLEKSHELQSAVNKLRLAKQHLQKEIRLVDGQVGAKEYRERLDSGICTEEEQPTAEDLVDEVRTRRGSWMWTTGEQHSFDSYNGGRRRMSKGLEAVVDRLPELRRRYETSNGGPVKSLRRVRNKLLAFGNFASRQATSDSNLEEIEEDTQSLEDDAVFRAGRRATLTVNDAEVLRRSPSLNSCSSVTTALGTPSLPGMTHSPPTSVRTLTPSTPSDLNEQYSNTEDHPL